MNYQGHSTGFTILEVSVIIVLLGLLALLAFRPMKTYLCRIDFQNSAENTKRLIQAGQSRAMANPNVHVGVYFVQAKRPQRVFLFEVKANAGMNQYDGPGDPQYLQPEVLKPGLSLETLLGPPDEILRDTLDVLASTGRVRLGR